MAAKVGTVLVAVVCAALVGAATGFGLVLLSLVIGASEVIMDIT